MISTALTIAGSDPSGGAGIQADLKTFSKLNVYGMAVIAALTAQNTVGVLGVMEVPADFIGLQLDAVFSDIAVHAAKTGMLGSAEAVEIVARKIRERRVSHLIVDPVMVSSSGTPLLESAGVDRIRKQLIPFAELITPNLAEAAQLTGSEVTDLQGMERAARRLIEFGARNVLVKGGHVEGDAVDVFFDGKSFEHLSTTRIDTRNLHGTGCVLSAAITAHVAQGLPLLEAVRKSKTFVTDAIKTALALGQGSGPVNPG